MALTRMLRFLVLVLFYFILSCFQLFYFYTLLELIAITILVEIIQAVEPTDMEKSNTLLISSGCDTAPIHLINRTFSSCKSASLNSFIMASKVTSSPCSRTVRYTADLKSAGMVVSPLQWASNLLRASVIVAGLPPCPIQPRTRPLKSESKWPSRNKRRDYISNILKISLTRRILFLSLTQTRPKGRKTILLMISNKYRYFSAVSYWIIQSYNLINVYLRMFIYCT